MNNKNLIRTAAIIYSEENNALKSATVQRKIIEAVLVEGNNEEMSIDQIIDAAKSSLEMIFDADEVEKIINDDKHAEFEVRLDKKLDEPFIKLSTKRFERLKERESEQSIEPQIERFINEIYDGPISKEKLGSILHKYFYELLNKNIAGFKKISKPSNKTGDLYIDPNLFSETEADCINSFLDWDDEEKNKTIFALISYAIEYAVITNNHESSALLLDAIKAKVFFLDNNVLYRAIGLNGDSRQKRILTFLEKCNSSGQELKISKFSKQEFTETIKYHIKCLERVPFRKINYKLFTKYSVDPSVYEYYHKWKATRTTYSFDLFLSHILTELDKFCKKFNIDVEYDIPFDEKGKSESKIIEKYKDEIAIAKGYGYDQSHYFDAINTYFVEVLRGANKNSITDTKFFFVSTDQKLRSWDFERNDFQPIALLPSQWMAILLKYFSRTTDDYKSFISFLKLKAHKPIISSENLQTVLAGISELTENFENQEIILNRLVEVKFDGILNGENDVDEIYEKTIETVSRQFENEIEEIKKERNKNANDLIREKIIFKKSILDDKINSRKEMARQKIPIDSAADTKFGKFKLYFALTIIGYCLGLIILTVWLTWEVMEPITYFLSIGGVIASFLYPMIMGKDINPKVFFDLKKKEIKLKTYSHFKFNIERFEGFKSEEYILEEEIRNLESELNNN